jgi:hypothetical protein
MDSRIELLIMDYNCIRGLYLKEEPSAITDQERTRYENLSLQFVRNFITDSRNGITAPDEAFNGFHCLNVEDDIFVYNTAFQEFNTVGISRVGYQLVNDVYVRK